ALDLLCRVSAHRADHVIDFPFELLGLAGGYVFASHRILLGKNKFDAASVASDRAGASAQLFAFNALPTCHRRRRAAGRPRTSRSATTPPAPLRQTRRSPGKPAAGSTGP